MTANQSESTVSVLMPVYNGERFLHDAIESILAQTRSDFSLIIANDGSTDHSSEIIDSYCARDARISALHGRHNRGVSDCLNKAVSRSEGTYLAHIDCDDMVEPRWLESQIQYMETRQIDILGVSQIQVIDEENQNLFRFLNPSGRFEVMLRMYVEGALLLTHSGTVYRKSVLTQLGGYDTNLKYAVDTDILLRACARGFRVDNNPDTRIFYRKHKSQITSACQSEQEMYEHESVKNFMTEILGQPLGISEGKLLRAESYDPSHYFIWDVSQMEIRKTYGDSRTLLETFELKRRMAEAFFSRNGQSLGNRLRAGWILRKTLLPFLTPELDEVAPRNRRRAWIYRWLGNLILPRLIPPLRTRP